MSTNANSDTALDAPVVTTTRTYDGNGIESDQLTYNVSVGQTPLVINPTNLPGGAETIAFNIANLDKSNENYVGSPDNTFDDQYKLSLQYGQGTASLIATSLATGAASTVATVNDVATMLINGQWEPVGGFLTINSLVSNGLVIDTGPKILLDQSGGTTGSAALSLSGNVVSYLPGEMFNFADGEVVNIADNGVQVAAATIHSVNVPGTQRYLGPNDTAWNAAFSLVPGDNRITITTTDANGLTGSASLDDTYTAPGSTAGGSTGSGSVTSGAGSSTGAGSGGGSGSVPADSITIDPDVTFLGHGAFLITGHAAGTAGVAQVELTADIDGVATDLGAATVNPDGSFSFTDHVGAHAQGFITATLTDGAGQTTTADAAFDLQAGIAGAPYVAVQNVYDPGTGGVASTSLFHQDGSRAVHIDEAGQTLASSSFDTFLNGGQPETTFVFDPGHGLDVIQGFRATGAGHNTISLPASDFTVSVAPPPPSAGFESAR